MTIPTDEQRQQAHQLALLAGSWFDRKDLTNHEREAEVAAFLATVLTDAEARALERAAAAIQSKGSRSLYTAKYLADFVHSLIPPTTEEVLSGEVLLTAKLTASSGPCKGVIATGASDVSEEK